MTTLEKINFHGWSNCYRLSNKEIELVVTTDVGPRVSAWGFKGGTNEFAEYLAEHGKTGGDNWRIFGGHRLWHAPESIPRTYYPDNFPIKLEEHTGFIRVIQPTEPTTGIQKEIDFAMADDKNMVKVTHRLKNNGLWAVDLAIWALSVMTTGGVGILPLPPRGTHTENLLPTNSMTIWAYTDMSDPRWTWGKKYILLRQDPKAETPQKVGYMNLNGWAAYANHNNLFVKTFIPVPGATYPDFGCSVETFTNADMLELETVGPMVKLEPGATVEHLENWYLFRDVPAPKNDADVDKFILPKVLAL
jgi:hypothetical protein